MTKRLFMVIAASVLFLSMCSFLNDSDKNQKSLIETVLDETKLHKNKIDIKNPTTPYKALNDNIYQHLEEVRHDFYSFLTEPEVQADQEYTLYVTYNESTYKDILSYIFYIETYTGGAHPDHKIWTVNYDVKKNEFITIDTLINNNPDILKALSEASRKKLLKNPKITSTEMMYSGTTPEKTNFEHFNFLENGLVIYFERYQVAPYVSGSISVTIPYHELSLNY